ITVNQEKANLKFADEVAEKARELGIRLTVDNSNETVGRKIRDAEVMKVPYAVVIGDKEVKSGKLVPRVRKDIEVSGKHDEHTYEDFLKTVANEAKTRVNKTSL